MVIPRRLVIMTSRAAPKEPGPAVQVIATPDPDKEREWWSWWKAQPVTERSRPAAEVLAEVRDDDT